MDLNQIINRNYSATVKRGLINTETSPIDFISKIEDETDEILGSLFDLKFDEAELADVILVCLAMAKHYDIDIQKALSDKVMFNENRKD